MRALLKRKTQASCGVSAVLENASSKGWVTRLSVAGLLLSLFLWAYLTLQATTLFPVKTVKFEGQYDRLDQNALKNTVMPYVSGGFFRLDVKGIKQSLEGLPWISGVKVHRVWPDRILVVVDQEQPVARWNQAGVFNNENRIFYPPDQGALVSLPQLTGPEDQQRNIIEGYQQMRDVLRPLGLAISDVTLDDRHAWALRLDNGMRLVLGRNDYLGRLVRFTNTYPRAIGSRGSDVEYIDLRYDNGMAVRWRNASRYA